MYGKIFYIAVPFLMVTVAPVNINSFPLFLPEIVIVHVCKKYSIVVGKQYKLSYVGEYNEETNMSPQAKQFLLCKSKLKIKVSFVNSNFL